MLQIGSLSLPSPFLQAPMAGFSNDAWRRILLKFGGCGLLASEMMHARGSLEMERRRKTLHGRLFGLPLREETGRETANPFRDAGVPLAVQIWDNQTEPLAEFARKLVFEYDVQVIDMNFGCPAPDVTQKAHCGSWLLQFPDRMRELASAVVEAVRKAGQETGRSVPVTAKMRLGYFSDVLTYRDASHALEDAGVDALTVHGRTGKQMYTGSADWEKIAEIKNSVHVPVIGNGDIRTARGAVHSLETYGVDGVMLGRAALNEPWIFRQASDLLAGIPEENALRKPAPTVQRDLLLEHFEVLLEQHSELEAVMLMRKFAPCYGTGMRCAKQFRIRIVETQNAAEFRRVVQEFFPLED